MNIKSFIIFLNFFAGLFLSVEAFCADSNEASPPQILTMPSPIQQQICQRLLRNKEGCSSDVQIIFDRSFKLDNDKNLLFFYLKDKNDRYSFVHNISASLDSKGKWKVGQMFLGQPRHLVRDHSRGLWLHTQYNVEGQSPSVLYSKDGYSWKDIDLPATPKTVTFYDDISKLCISNKEVMIDIHASEADEGRASVFWKAPVSSLAAAPHAKLWKPATRKLVNSVRCLSVAAKNNHWLIQDGETMTLMIHPKKHLTVKIVHRTVTKKMVNIKQSMPIKHAVANKAATKKNFAVQIAAYKNMLAANSVIQQLQKAGFQTFTRVLDSKGGKIRKIYIGPYANRESATEKKKVLKSSFRASKRFQSAFVLKFR